MMTPEAQAALLENFRASLPIILDGTEERTWPADTQRFVSDPEWDCPPADDRITMSRVLDAVSQATGYSRAVLTGARRSAHYVTARWIAYHLMAELCQHATIIGVARIMNRDHTTIRSGLQRYAARCAENPDIRATEFRARAIIGGSRAHG